MSRLRLAEAPFVYERGKQILDSSAKKRDEVGAYLAVNTQPTFYVIRKYCNN